ncbi:MAG: RagB/SusD family nutrient uptake outer membrane protein [Cyclobacteriaceae bacterium]
MKKLKYLLIVAIFIGCDDFITLEPQDSLTSSGFYKTESDAISAINATYSAFQTLNYYGFNLPVLTNVSAQDAVKGGFGAGDRAEYQQFADYTVADNNTWSIDFYKSAFGGINRANQVLDNVSLIEVGADMSQEVKTRVLGEAHFLRALNYYNLACAYGGLPLFSAVQDINDPVPPRASLEETWGFIISDFEMASSMLPDTYAAGDLGRATAGAANAMLARIHTARGEYTDAKFYVDAVIGSSANYDLNPDYYENFTEAGNNNVESIFEIQYSHGTASLGVWSGTGDWNSNQVSRYTAPQGQPASGGGGWAFMQPSQDLVDDYESGDLRLSGTVYMPGDPIGDGVFEPNASTHASNAGLYGNKKYTTVNADGTGGQGAAVNYKVIRFGEILLLKAEVENELNAGVPQEALDAFNRIRLRAGLPEVNATNNPGLDQASFRDIIMHERRIELAMEGITFFDANQRGIGLDLFGDHGFQAGDELFPLPASEIELTGWGQN